MASYFMLFISDTKLHPDAGSIYNHKLANCTIFTETTLCMIFSPQTTSPRILLEIDILLPNNTFSYKFLIFTEIQNPKNTTP